ncbi:endothelin-converting enzyme homolog isoform X2 [Adelges cooleyi]|nr:endothelin-converting enzyme homolog isoform X2 [Adelges cooleyi]
MNRALSGKLGELESDRGTNYVVNAVECLWFMLEIKKAMNTYGPSTHEVLSEDLYNSGNVRVRQVISLSLPSCFHFIRERSYYLMKKWKKKTFLEKCFICLMVFFAVIAFSLLLQIRTLYCKSSSHYDIEFHSSGQGYCLNETCVTTAAGAIKNMNSKLNPCDNFYNYACSKWIKSNPIPEGRSIWNIFHALEKNNMLIIKNSLEALPIDHANKAELKAKTYFATCMDPNDTLEALGPKPLKDILDDIGGWNISGAWDVSTWSLQLTLETAHNRYNMDGLFDWSVMEDYKNSSRYVIEVVEGSLSLPNRNFYLDKENQKMLDVFLDYMTKIGTLLGGEPTITRKQMKNVLEFETRLAEIKEPEENKNDLDKTYHLLSLKELQDLAPFLHWNHYFNSAFRLVNKKITNQEKVVVSSPSYIAGMSKLIDEYFRSPEKKTIINNYLAWQTVWALSPYLSKDFRNAYNDLRKVILGEEGMDDAWRYCITDTNSILGFATSSLYIRKVFNGHSKTLAKEMIEEIKASFKENFYNLQWMDEETLIEAEKKADAISDMIGYPDYIMDAQQMEDKYKDLIVNPDEYFMNMIRAIQFNFRQNLNILGQPVNRTWWSMVPTTANAYYTPTKNQIVFPAGILQPPFFSQMQLPVMNYGALGVVMGHELTHAFDNTGRQYDRFGNKHQWWNNATVEKFNAATECMINQYSSYKIKGMHVNGSQTLGENIADNGGLKAAYRAYSKYLDDGRAQVFRLPGVNLDNRQMFFLSFAQVWCSSSTDDGLKLQIEKDMHSPFEFRVNGPLSNFDEFSEVFNCKLGTPMNPAKKCTVW